MKAENIKEAKELIVKYRSFTVKDIKIVWDSILYKGNKAHFTANQLTGFGTCVTCTLCIAGTNDPICSKCVYVGYMNCINNEHKETYFAIDNAETPYQLWLAFRRRANHIEKILKT